MAEKQNTPEIRFEGFTDPWEQRKLGELCELNPTAVLPDSFEYVDLESVAGTDMISHRREEKLTAPSRAQRLASFGDIFYQTVRPYQKNNYFFELPDEDYVFSTGYAQLRPLCDGRFLFSSLQRDQFVSCVLEHCTGTSYPAINANDLAALFLAVPIDAEEQRLVGSILKPIDSLITLHQRKCQYRGLYGYLSWEQRKLGEIFEEYSEKNRADLPPLTIIQGGGTVYRDESNRNLQFDKNSLSNYKAVNPDDFIVHLRSFEGGLEKATYCGLISPAYHTFHGDGIDSDFYYLYFRSKRFIDTDLKPHVYGIRDGRSIDIDGMKTIPIPWTTVNEQRAIGRFYNSLDSFITLHQRECERLRRLKAAMLDKMFV